MWTSWVRDSGHRKLHACFCSSPSAMGTARGSPMCVLPRQGVVTADSLGLGESTSCIAGNKQACLSSWKEPLLSLLGRLSANPSLERLTWRVATVRHALPSKRCGSRREPGKAVPPTRHHWVLAVGLHFCANRTTHGSSTKWMLEIYW